MPKLGGIRRVGAGLVAVVALASVGSGAALVVEAGAADAGPTGYTTTLDFGTPVSCRLASVDLGAGGAVTGIGPTYKQATDGCPIDLAIRAGDARIWAVVTPTNVNGASLGGVPGKSPAATPPPSRADPAADPSTTASEGDGSADAADFGASSLVTIDPSTGVRTAIGDVGVTAIPDGGALAFDAAGNLWLYALTDDPACVVVPANLGQCLYRLDPATGVASFVARGPVPVGGAPTLMFGATATCTAVLATALDFESPVVAVPSLSTVDTATGALDRAPSPYGTGAFSLQGLERDATGTLRGIGFVGIDAPWASYTIDATTGLATAVAPLADPPNEGEYIGLAIAGLTCPAPAVVVTPTFTG